MKNNKNLITVLFILFSLFPVSAKSKRTMVVNTVAVSADTNIENARVSLANGNYEKADYFLDTAYKLALSVDNNDVLTKVCLTKVSVYLSEFPANLEKANETLEKAKSFAKESNNVIRNNALCDLSQVRINLLSDSVDYSDCLKVLEKNQSVFSKEPFELAQVYSIQGDVYKLSGKYSDAEKKYSEAIQIFTKECYLSELGINWYKLAQTYSLNKNKKSALEALEKAIKYDRDAENSYALGADYYAKGIILLKENPSESEKSAAKKAFIHSAEIYEAGDMLSLAEKSRSMIEKE